MLNKQRVGILKKQGFLAELRRVKIEIEPKFLVSDGLCSDRTSNLNQKRHIAKQLLIGQTR